jgi:hypothetical protein
MLKEALAYAFGSYIEQEPKKQDQWRDQTWGQLYAHLKNEIAEIGRSKGPTVQLHNAIDAVMLAAMLVVKAQGERCG